MRIPRRAAVTLSAATLSGTLAACGGDAEEPAGTDTETGVEEPTLTDPSDVADPDVPVAPGEEDVPEEVVPTS